MARNRPKQGNKNLIIIGAVLLAVVLAVIAYGYSASQKNKVLAEQAAVYNAQKEAKANAEEARQAALKQKVESQQQAWGNKSSEQLAAEQAQENKERTVTSIEGTSTDGDVNSTFMSFSDCKARLSASMLSVAGNYKTDLIVDSGEIVMGRICTNDGSVLVTCSKPDGKMITKKSDSTGCL